MNRIYDTRNNSNGYTNRRPVLRFEAYELRDRSTDLNVGPLRRQPHPDSRASGSVEYLVVGGSRVRTPALASTDLCLCI